MKTIWHEKPGGAMWKFKEFRFEDMVPMSLIRGLPKADREKLAKESHRGRRKRETATAVYSKLCRVMWSKIVDRMMESERFVLDKEHSMYIGRIDKDVNLVMDEENQRRFYSMTHGIILNGFFHSYYFRMPARRRKELKLRVKKGQSFIV